MNMAPSSSVWYSMFAQIYPSFSIESNVGNCISLIHPFIDLLIEKDPFRANCDIIYSDGCNLNASQMENNC